MTIQELTDIFLSQQRRRAIEKSLGGDVLCTSYYSLAGSSVAMLLAAMPSHETPILVIGDNLDDAGYLYHDLERILGENAVLMFPSGYKRDIKYGQVDAVSDIAHRGT